MFALFCTIAISFSLWGFIRNLWPFTDSMCLNALQLLISFDPQVVRAWWIEASWIQPLGPFMTPLSQAREHLGFLTTRGAALLPKAAHHVLFRWESIGDKVWASGTHESWWSDTVQLLWSTFSDRCEKILLSRVHTSVSNLTWAVISC